MGIVYIITHPEVVIDPNVPVPDWPLSEEGRRRMARALDRPFAHNLRRLFTSAERKARDAADIIAARVGLEATVIGALGENDRSATGYLPREEFEATADVFFARPNDSVRGWERATDAQARMVWAMETVLKETDGEGDIAVVSHGAVAALFLCHLKGIAITREADQPLGGGGHFYRFDAASRALLSGWLPIESM